jgi:hypothetical protein
MATAARAEGEPLPVRVEPRARLPLAAPAAEAPA